MANMSYCRFENTYEDLKDCEEYLNENDSLEEALKNANSSEKKYILKLVKMCISIANSFEDEYNELTDDQK